MGPGPQERRTTNLITHTGRHAGISVRRPRGPREETQPNPQMHSLTLFQVASSCLSDICSG